MLQRMSLLVAHRFTLRQRSNLVAFGAILQFPCPICSASDSRRSAAILAPCLARAASRRLGLSRISAARLS